LKHSYDAAVWLIDTLGEAAQPIEMTKELVGAVKKMNDQFIANTRCGARIPKGTDLPNKCTRTDRRVITLGARINSFGTAASHTIFGRPALVRFH